MTIQQIADYSEYNNPPYLLQFMKGGDIEKIAEASDHQFNDFETAVFGVMNGLWLDTATGVQLDILGKHLNLLRNGRGDASYATLLRIASLIYVSSGQPDVLIEAVRSLYGATVINYTPNYPMKVTISQNGAIALFIVDTYLLENGDTFTLDNGDTYEFNVEDVTAETVLAAAVPSGVGLTVSKI